MGGFLGLGHSSAKTDRSNFLGGIKDIGNVFNYALPAAKSSLGAGTDLLGSAGSYFKNLLSGNRSAMLQSVAPEAAAVNAKSDATKRQLSTSGTARGGGVAATNATAKDRAMSEIDNLLFGVRSGAAQGAAEVGKAEAGLGANLLNQASGAAGNLAEESRLSRVDSQKINQDLVAKVATTIENVASAIFG